MPIAHEIRLQGPWELLPSDRSDEPERIRLPDEWATLGTLDGAPRIRRRFHRPTGLGATDTVLLFVPLPPESCLVDLNGRQAVQAGVASDAGSRWVLNPLELSNVITIHVQDNRDFEWSTVTAPVRIEIHHAVE